VSIKLKKTLNSAKAKLEQAAGPARKSQHAAPVIDAIRNWYAEESHAFAIPAHKGGSGSDPRIHDVLGQAFHADISMNNGVDNRHQSWKVQATAQKLAAEAFGADQTMFSTGGSTLSVLAAMTTAAGPGDTIAVARNLHKSAASGLIHSGARPVWIEPDYDEDWEVAHCVTPDSVRGTLHAHPECKAVFLVSPTYYGVAGDLAAIADICHERGVPLVTDDAWGALFAFHPELPPGAMHSGVDLAIGSVHKSLSGLSQTSFLSMQGDRIDSSRLLLAFENFESSSSSALLISSIDAARRQFVEDGERLIGDALALAGELRAAISEIPGLRLMGDEILARPGASAFNPLHVSFDVTGLGITGYHASDWLRGHHQLAIELADHRRLMALISFADRRADIHRLIGALHDLADNHDRTGSDIPRLPTAAQLRTETAMSPRDAFYAPTRMIPIGDAAGEIAAEMICPYPPGIPVILPGERFTDTIIDFAQQGAAAGFFVEGVVDPSLSKVRVVDR
jgi:arginine/lysine/ornithine decarboxylase